MPCFGQRLPSGFAGDRRAGTGDGRAQPGLAGVMLMAPMPEQTDLDPR